MNLVIMGLAFDVNDDKELNNGIQSFFKKKLMTEVKLRRVKKI